MVKYKKIPSLAFGEGTAFVTITTTKRHYRNININGVILKYRVYKCVCNRLKIQFRCRI